MADMIAFAPLRAPAVRENEAPAAAAKTLDDMTRPPPAMRWALGALVVGLLTTERFAVAVGSGSSA
jgi:hypothetical protein